MKTRLLGVTLGIAGTLGLASAAWGHAVQTDYLFDLITAELEFTATFSTGEPMEEATVEIYAPNDSDTPWRTTTTDANGTFSFLPDESIQGEWRVEIGSDGHQDILLVPVGEDGVDYNRISSVENRDVHYAAFAPEAIGIFAALSLGACAIATRRHTAR